jgi:hypothetical protein
VGLPQKTLAEMLIGLLGGLRFPYLFLLAGGLFVLDLFVPDLVPFVDEIMLGLLTLLLGSFRRRKRPETPEGPQAEAGRVIDVDPE